MREQWVARTRSEELGEGAREEGMTRLRRLAMATGEAAGRPKDGEAGQLSCQASLVVPGRISNLPMSIVDMVPVLASNAT